MNYYSYYHEFLSNKFKIQREMEKWVCDFICASAAGIVGTFIGHPLDTIKVIANNLLV